MFTILQGHALRRRRARPRVDENESTRWYRFSVVGREPLQVRRRWSTRDWKPLTEFAACIVSSLIEHGHARGRLISAVLDLAKTTKDAVKRNGMLAWQFNTIGVCRLDGLLLRY